MCVPSSLVQAPLSSGSFLEVDQGSPHLPGFHWGVGVWSGMRRVCPLRLSLPFCSSTGLSPRGSLALRGGRGGGVKSSGNPFPNVCLSWAVFFQERPLSRVSEPALHTDASPSVSWPTTLELVVLGKEASCFLLVTAGQLCSPPLPTLGNQEGGRGVGGPCRPWMIQPKGAALRLGLLGYYSQSRGLSASLTGFGSSGAPGTKVQITKADASTPAPHPHCSS